MTRRQERLNEQFREEISDLLLRHLKDPRLAGVVSITEVSISPDMKNASVFVSVLGDEEQKQTVLAGMVAASGFIRRELGRRLDIRYMPEIACKLDETIEKGAYMLNLINQVSVSDEPKVVKKVTRKQK